MESGSLAEFRSGRWDTVGIVEAQEPGAIRCMERERIGQPMRTFPGRGNVLDLELDPKAALEDVFAAVEGQEKFQPEIAILWPFNIIS